jgi:hypothetical protein
MPLKRTRIPFNQPTYYGKYTGPIKAHLNTSRSDKRFDVYRPSFTYYQNPTELGFAKYILNVELSLPKIIYGNNFIELTDDDFDNVVLEIKKSLDYIGVDVSIEQIENAEAVKIDFSKNILFKDYTSASSVIKSIATADTSKVYDVDYTKYKNGGQAFHIHTNCEDIVVYDKIADLKQAKRSDKRAVENDSYIQLKLLDKLAKQKGLSVVRFEVRLNGKRKIRALLSDAGVTVDNLRLRTLFKTEVAQKILLHSWNKILSSVPKIPLNSDNSYSIFNEIIKDPTITRQKAEAKLGAILLLSANDTRHIRNLYDERFGKHTWGRLKNLRDPPSDAQLKALLYITNQLIEMKPVTDDEFG